MKVGILIRCVSQDSETQVFSVPCHILVCVRGVCRRDKATGSFHIKSLGAGRRKKVWKDEDVLKKVDSSDHVGLLGPPAQCLSSV